MKDTAQPWRRCSVCKRPRALAWFYKNGNGHFDSWCRPCRRAKFRDRRRQRYRWDDDYAAAARGYAKNYYAANAEALRAKRRARYQEQKIAC